MFKNLFGKVSIVGELFSFFWKEKMWWMIPMVIILILLGTPDRKRYKGKQIPNSRYSDPTISWELNIPEETKSLLDKEWIRILSTYNFTDFFPPTVNLTAKITDISRLVYRQSF